MYDQIVPKLTRQQQLSCEQESCTLTSWATRILIHFTLQELTLKLTAAKLNNSAHYILNSEASHCKHPNCESSLQD
jgi:hypothetical protein